MAALCSEDFKLLRAFDFVVDNLARFGERLRWRQGRGPKACKEDRGKASLIAADSEDIFGPRADAQPQDSLKGIAPNTLSKIFS